MVLQVLRNSASFGVCEFGGVYGRLSVCTTGVSAAELLCWCHLLDRGYWKLEAMMIE